MPGECHGRETIAAQVRFGNPGHLRELVLSGCNATAKVFIVSVVNASGPADAPPGEPFDGERFAVAASHVISLRNDGDPVREGLSSPFEGRHVTLPSASSPNERPLDNRGEGDAIAAAFAPPAGAVSLAELIADSGPLPADAALECVQRIAERLTNAGRPSCAALAPGDVFVDDDGGVWLRDSVETGRVDAERDGQPLTGMNRIGKLLAFVATGDGAHLTDGAKVDPATLPPPLSTVAYRLFSRNGACYRTYADLAHDIAQLRVVGSDAVDSDGFEKVASHVDGRDVSEFSPAVAVGRERLHEVETPAEANVAPNDVDPAEGSSRFAITVLVVILLGAAIAFVLWQLL